MMLIGKNQITWRQTCSGATLSTTDPTLTDLGLNPGLCTESGQLSACVKAQFIL